MQRSAIAVDSQVGAAQLSHLPPPGAGQPPDGMDEHISLTELVTGGEVRAHVFMCTICSSLSRDWLLMILRATNR